MNGRVVMVGDVGTDILAIYQDPFAVGSDTPARIEQTGGGAAANTATWLAATGRPVTLVGVVGADLAGEQRTAELRAAGVDCAVRAADGAPTGTVVVLSTGGERSMLYDRGANRLLSAGDIDAALDRAGDAVHLHLSGYTLLGADTRAAGRYALAAARERGLTASVDAASAGPLRQVGGAAFLSWVRGLDLLLANEDEAAALVGAPDPVRLAGEVRYAVVKRGSDGAVWAGDGTGPVEVPAERVEVVDATGAGDAFAAGLLDAWLAGAGPTDALRAGAHLGARAVATAGARPPLAGPPVTVRRR